jgi:hypothetical protein
MQLGPANPGSHILRTFSKTTGGRTMSIANGHSKESGTRPAGLLVPAFPVTELSRERLDEIIAELEVPFDTLLINWRVTNTTKGSRNLRGQVIPYATQRAYVDRLNALLTPAGWTRRYTVHTSANFERSEDQKTTAKVFVTCDLTIFGIGSHSATGEEWADDENACTSAEAQAFKRACACFGLGRYLYHFTGKWVDLDERKRPKTTPKLVGWATPEGWRKGLRPDRHTDQQSPVCVVAESGTARRAHGTQSGTPLDDRPAMIHQIEAMAKPLGRGLYRGILKAVGRIWQPSQIQDIALMEEVLAQMQAAVRALDQLETALAKTGSEPLNPILHSLNLKSLNQVNNLETLQNIVLALESRTDLLAREA